MSVRYITWAFNQNLKSPMQKLTLVKIADNADDSGLAFPSIEHIAKFTCASESTVKRSIREIVEKGLMTINKMPAAKNYKRNEYWLHLEVVLNYDAIADESSQVSVIPEENSQVRVTDLTGQSDLSQVSERPTNRQLTVNEPSVNNICKQRTKKFESFKLFFDLYPAHRKGGTDQTAWKKWKSCKCTDQDGWAAYDWIQQALTVNGWSDSNYVPGITKFIEEKRWFTPLPVQQPTTGLDMNSTDWINDMGEVL